MSKTAHFVLLSRRTLPPLMLLIAVFFAVLWGRPNTLKPEPGQAMSEKRGYKAAVDLLVERKCLTLETGGARKRVVLAPAKPGCPSRAALDSYSKATFLGGDMAGLVDQRWQFVSAETTGGGSALNLRAIRKNAHSLRFAGGDHSIWGGTIAYAPRSGEPDSSDVWAGATDVRDTLGACPNMRIDGEAGVKTATLHQFVTCDDKKLSQRVRPVQAISRLDLSAERTREPTLASAAKRLEVPSLTKSINGSIDSSIQHDLHFAMQRVLGEHLKDARNNPNKNEKTVRAGLLLMDGLTGEIHAAATHPAKPEDIGSDQADNWRTKNWNFEQLEIGSTAKIPFAAAIAQAKPKLVVNGQGPTKAWRPGFCGGVQNCKDRAREGLGLNFRQFIQFSSNGHALWLLDQAQKGNTPGWEDNLRTFACIEPMRGKRDTGCGKQLWTTRKGHPIGESEPYLQLDMGSARRGRLYSEYYINILGGMKSSWTNVNLAQAYARIFSDRKVNPRLTDDGVEGGVKATTRLNINSGVWAAIRDGMRGVVLADGKGTAFQLCKRLACANGNQYGNLWLYAKTGTATISTKAGDNSKTFVLLVVKTASAAPPNRPADITALKVIVITQRYNADGASAVDLAIDLFGNTEFRKWLEIAPKPAPSGNGTTNKGTKK